MSKVWNKRPIVCEITIDGCHEVISHKPNKAYGYVSLSRKNKHIYAHRLSWIEHYGEIPKGLYVLHSCDNPKCVNPNHLFLGTTKDNVHDMHNKNRQASKKGELNGRARLNIKQINTIRDSKGKISCNELARIYNVHQTTISAIWTNRNWKHIKENEKL